mgnify:FL=1
MKTKLAKIRHRLFNFYMDTYILFVIILFLFYAPAMSIKKNFKKLLIMISNAVYKKLLSFIQTKQN